MNSLLFLGDSDFVQQVLKQDELKMEQALEIRNKGWDMEKLISHVCERCHVEKIRLKGRANTLAQAKVLICYWGSMWLGSSSTALGARLNISQSAVSRGVKKWQTYCIEKGLEFKIS